MFRRNGSLHRMSVAHHCRYQLVQQLSHKYRSNEIGRASFVSRRNQPGAAELITNTRSTRLEMAISKASAPFSINAASSITRTVGCSERILSGSLPGNATNNPPSFSSSCLYDCRSRGRSIGKIRFNPSSC